MVVAAEEGGVALADLEKCEVVCATACELTYSD